MISDPDNRNDDKEAKSVRKKFRYSLDSKSQLNHIYISRVL